MTSRNVEIDLRANTGQYQRSMRSATSETKQLSGSLGGIGNAAKLGAASAVAAVGLVGAAVTKVMQQGVEMAVPYEKSLSMITGLVGIAKEEVDGMNESLKQISSETARGPQELADALFFITSAGLRGKDAIDALEVSAQAATAGLGDTAVIADVVTSAVNAYGKALGGAATATDVLVATVREGKAEASSLASSMGRVIPIASQMGVSFDQVGAAIAAMTRTGLDANEASTALRSILNSLLAPTSDASKALDEVGLSAAGLRAEIRDKGLFATLQTLAAAFDGNDEATTRVFGNVRALTGVLSLMGSNAAATEQIFKSLATSTGSLGSALDAATGTAGFQFEKAMNDIKLAVLEAGEEALPKLAEIVESIAPMLPDLISGLGDLGVAFVDLAAAIIPTLTNTLDKIDLYILGVEKISLAGRNVFSGLIDTLNQIPNSIPGVNIPKLWSDTTEQALKWTNTQIRVNNALRDGVDPANVIVTALKEMQAEGTLYIGTVDELVKQVHLSDDAWGAQAATLVEQARAAGWTNEQIQVLIQSAKEEFAAVHASTIAKKEAIGEASALASAEGDVASAAGDVTGAVAATIDPLVNFRGAAQEAAAAGRDLADMYLEATDPAFKAAKAVAAASKSEADYQAMAKNSKASIEDKAAAEAKWVEDTLKAQAALDAVGTENVTASIDAIQAVTGRTKDEAYDLLEALGLLDGKQIAVQIAFKSTLYGPAKELTGSIGNLFSGNAPKRAMGGAVTKDMPYEVGERGRELFVPGQSGTIIPNHVLTSNTSNSTKSVNLTVNGSADPARDGESLLLLATIGGI